MTDSIERAQRIADAVLKAKPALPEASLSPSQAAAGLVPIRDLMISLDTELKTRRSAASITVLEPRDIHGQFRSEDYSLHSNAGRHRMLHATFTLNSPGQVPFITLHGLDEQGSAEIRPLLEDGRIPASQMDQILEILECFLIRFLAGDQALSNGSDYSAHS